MRSLVAELVDSLVRELAETKELGKANDSIIRRLEEIRDVATGEHSAGTDLSRQLSFPFTTTTAGKDGIRGGFPGNGSGKSNRGGGSK